MIMCNALILGMIAMLVSQTEMDDSTLFWIYWVACVVFNMIGGKDRRQDDK